MQKVLDVHKKLARDMMNNQINKDLSSQLKAKKILKEKDFNNVNNKVNNDLKQNFDDHIEDFGVELGHRQKE